MEDPTKETRMNHCLNCGREYEGNFCPYCGQKGDTKRLQLRTIFVVIASVFIKRDNKTLSTIRGLIAFPGNIARDYILGRRIRHNAPMPLLVGLVALYTILTFSIPDAVTPYNVINPMGQSVEGLSPTMSAFVVFMKSVFDNKVYFALISSIMNVVPYWFVFRRCKLERPDGRLLPLNLAEHFFTMLYLACINMLLAFFVLPLNLTPSASASVNFVSLVLPTLFTIHLYRQLLSLSWIRSLWLTLLSMLLSILMNVTLVLLIFGVITGYDAVAAS